MFPFYFSSWQRITNQQQLDGIFISTSADNGPLHVCVIHLYALYKFRCKTHLPPIIQTQGVCFFVSSKKTKTRFAKVRRSPVFAYLATEVRWGWVEGVPGASKGAKRVGIIEGNLGH